MPARATNASTTTRAVALWICLLALPAIAGRALALDTAPLLTAFGEDGGDRLGWSVSAVGDVNGDGWADFAAGAPLYGAGYTLAGRAYVYFGGAAADSVPDLILAAEADGDRFALCVGAAGDVNGDGFADVIVGVPYQDAGGSSNDDRGRAYLFLGGDPLGTAPPDSLPDLILTGEAAGDRFGWSVGGGRDLDGDGYADLLVGAPYADAGGPPDDDRGRVYVFRGGPALDAVPDLVVDGRMAADLLGWSVACLPDFDGDAAPDLAAGALLASEVLVLRGGAALDSLPDYVISGESDGDRFGYTVADAGDMDGDGLGDLIVGALLNDAGGLNAGRAYVFAGGLVPGPHGAGSATRVYTGEAADDWFGRAVSGAGDLDRDGRADVIVGAPGKDVASATAGRAYVFLGAGPAGAVPASAADLILTGAATGDRYGHSVSAGRDPAGGGHDHLVIGAPLAAVGGSLRGSVSVLRVSPPGNRLPIALPDTFAVAEAETLVVPAPGLLANDTDADGDTLRAVLVLGPAHGALALADDGGFVYAHDGSAAAPDSFVYAADDGRGGAAQATVVIAVVDTTAPGPAANLAVAPGHRAVTVTWQDPTAADLVALEIWRARWDDGDGASAYPLYDDAPGDTIPPLPANRAAAATSGRWTLVGEVAAGSLAFLDADTTLAQRGVYWYEVFARDDAGNYSGPAGNGARATSYLLGDAAAPADGVVDAQDAAALTAGFGLTRGQPGFDAQLDYGPTDDMSRRGIPLTDGRVDFEDLMICAMRYLDPGAGEPPADPPPPLTLLWTQVGTEAWALTMPYGHPSVQGLRLRVTLPAGYVGVLTPGALLGQQTAPVFLRETPGAGIDASLAVLGAGAALTGTGELLRLTLVAESAASPPVVTIARAAQPGLPVVTARTPANLEVLAEVRATTDVPGAEPLVALGARPNPFNPATRIGFTLPAASHARVTVHRPDGGLVAVLADAWLPAGSHEILWRGRDDRGRPLASGVYLCRLATDGSSRTLKLLLAK